MRKAVMEHRNRIYSIELMESKLADFRCYRRHRIPPIATALGGAEGAVRRVALGCSA
jgi:hypothetical protein